MLKELKCRLGFHKFSREEEMTSYNGDTTYKWKLCSRCNIIKVNDDWKLYWMELQFLGKEVYTAEEIYKLWNKK